MKAKGMFEKLGLKEIESKGCGEHSIRYYKENDSEWQVAFYISAKSVYYELGEDEKRNLELLKAINNKLKELKWIK